MTWNIPIFVRKHSWNSQKILDCRAKILLNLNHLSILAAREMTVHFCKRSYFALVIEVVSYEKGSDCHPHLLIGPLNTTIPSIPAKSSDFIHSINPQHKQDYFHISTFSQNWASKIKIFSAKIQMDLLELARLSKSKIFYQKGNFHIFWKVFGSLCACGGAFGMRARQIERRERSQKFYDGKS